MITCNGEGVNNHPTPWMRARTYWMHYWMSWMNCLRTHTLANIPLITITPPTPPPPPQHKSISCARKGPGGNLMEQWLARGRGASMRSQKVADMDSKSKQPHTKSQNTSKGTPKAVASHQPTNRATEEEHLTLHSHPRESEGDLCGLRE